MPMNAGKIIGILFLSLWLVACAVIAIKIFRSRFGPIKTVKATVVDKNRIEAFSKYAGNGKHSKYVIVFEVNGKKRSFYVSAFSYGGYRIGETGKLKYRGDRLIDFG